MTKPGMRSVSVYDGDCATVNDVMQLIARLPYLDLIEFAAAVSGDADKIADAAEHATSGKKESTDG